MYLIVSLMILLNSAFAAAPEVQTLAERLALDTLSELQIVNSSGGATHANYTLLSKGGVRPVLAAVQTKLLADGWVSHPNLGETSPSAAPRRGRPNLLSSSRQVSSFARANELLEVRAAPVGRSLLIGLRLKLIVGDASE